MIKKRRYVFPSHVLPYVIPPHLLRQAFALLGFQPQTEDPQEEFIDLLDNYRYPHELQSKTQLSRDECVFILHQRDLAAGFQRIKTKN